MKRRFFLGLAAAALLSGAVTARAQATPQTPADRVTVEELKRLLAEGKPVLVLDVRGHADLVIKGARHIPLDQVESRLGELPKGREVVTYCA
ncbi:MAG TPA: rhodanese-like domain-containing protein [Pyrinomonadaceae bacterium]|nr:rhodanese-like domain-containing protein [Pyrinomonadaceae bacterium]